MGEKIISEKQRLANIRRAEHLRNLYKNPAIRLQMVRKADPRLSALTSDERKIYKKLRGCGISKEEALREATKL